MPVNFWTTTLLPSVISALLVWAWSLENFFKYIRLEFALDALTDYAAEPMAPEQTVPNPERRNAQKDLAAAQAELREIHMLYGEAASANDARLQDRLRQDGPTHSSSRGVDRAS